MAGTLRGGHDVASVARPLENIARTAATSRNRERLAARSIMRDLRPRVRKMIAGREGMVEANVYGRLSSCGLPMGSEVRVRGVDGHSGVAGLQTCGSVWACPCCASKIGVRRTDETERGILNWTASGGRFFLLTLTMQHHQGDRLSDLWDGLSEAWRLWGMDGSVKRANQSLDRVGYHRTTEVTVGVNGWHVHLHVLMFVAGSASDDAAASAGSVFIARWIRSVERAGFSALSVGQDWKSLEGTGEALAQVAGYLHKGDYRRRDRTARSLALEVTRGDLKDGGGSRTPFGVLSDLVSSVEDSGVIPEDDLSLWAEWEEASHGRRQQVWSRGMRDLLGLEDEQSDEEIAAEDLGGDDLVIIDADEWRRFDRIPGAHAELLEAIDREVGFMARRMAAVNVLRKYGIRHTPVLWPGGGGGGSPA